MTGAPIHLGGLVEVIHPGHGEAGDIVRTYLVLDGPEPVVGTPIWDALLTELRPGLVAATNDVVEAKAAALDIGTGGTA